MDKITAQKCSDPSDFTLSIWSFDWLKSTSTWWFNLCSVIIFSDISISVYVKAMNIIRSYMVNFMSSYIFQITLYRLQTCKILYQALLCSSSFGFVCFHFVNCVHTCVQK